MRAKAKTVLARNIVTVVKSINREIVERMDLPFSIGDLTFVIGRKLYSAGRFLWQ
jgi:hypothetical protein